MSLEKGIVGLIRTAATTLPHDVKKLLEQAARNEENETAKSQLKAILDNIALAEKEKLPMCQDTGSLIFFIESSEPKKVLEAVYAAVDEATSEIPLRPNSVDPLTRKPLNANKPIVHIEHSNKETVTVLLKGAGSENASTLFMLNPNAGKEGIKKAVAEWVRKKAASACPPVIVGVGVGGTAEQALLESKKVLLNDLTKPLTPLEKEILDEVNASGIGPMGLGGKTTALTVKISSLPCHTASLPVAVNVQCCGTEEGELMNLSTPLSLEKISSLKLGQQIFLSGAIYTARDQALQRLQKQKLPALKNAVVYHCGPLAKKVGDKWVLVSAGPTTSSRMDDLVVSFIEEYEPRAIVGKAGVGKKVIETMQGKCVYLSFPGGCGALAAKHLAVESVEWLDLGMPEAVWRLQAKDLGPLTVAIDAEGNSLYGRMQ